MAQSQQEVVDALVAAAEEISVDDVVWGYCSHKHHDDEDAQALCQETGTKATNTLMAEFPELAKSLVLPMIETMLDESPITTGQTKFGGLPDVGPDFDWPASRTLTVEDAMRDYPDALAAAPVAVDAKSPLTFVAQLDLAELFKLDAEYPSEGRLLIFMDFGAWFGANYISEAAVLWDQTPDDALKQAKLPTTLSWMADVERGISGGLHQTDWPMTQFVAPEVPVMLTQSWSYVMINALDYENTAYRERVVELRAVDIYSDGYLYEGPDAFAYGHAQGEHPPLHQISGVPVPEQDDPRYEAAFLYVMGRLYSVPEDRVAFEAKLGLTGDALQAHEIAEGLKYKLLLQLDVASFLQFNGEGHFYFLIHEDDLKARNFDKVMAIYQQT